MRGGTPLVAAFAALAVIAMATSARAGDAALTVDQIGDCVRKNGPDKTMRQRLQMKTVDRMGDDRNFDVKGEWKRGDDGLSKMLLRISAPPDLRGTAFLMIEREGRSHDMWSYLPELDKVRRIHARSASGSLFGTDFSYEDFERVQNLADSANTARLADANVEDRAAWVVEGTPDTTDHSEYERIVGYIDQERCVPLKAEFFEGDGEPSKILTVPPDKVTREGESWIPMEMVMEDRENETRSLIVVKDIELDVEIPDRTFSQSALLRRR